MHRLFAPAQKAADRLGQWLGEYGYILEEKQAADALLQELQKQIAAYKLERLVWKEDQAELVRLQAMLGLSARNLSTARFINARVIARSPNTWDQFVTIDQGLNGGVELNMPVITPDGLVGLVMNVNARTAQVYLITDREIAVGVIVQPSREARGIVEGTGAAHELSMENIPYYSQLQVGDVVVTSGLSEIYPPGIPVGTVAALRAESNGLIMTAVITPLVAFDRLEEVMLVADAPEGIDFYAEPEPPREEAPAGGTEAGASAPGD
jgi:rod shape-determining protein MreC